MERNIKYKHNGVKGEWKNTRPKNIGERVDREER